MGLVLPTAVVLALMAPSGHAGGTPTPQPLYSDAQQSAGTGALVYLTLPPDGNSGLINPALYKIGADPQRYANDFYDITACLNQADPAVAGYPATTGWDPITGLGTPNAANLVPDLVSAVNGH